VLSKKQIILFYIIAIVFVVANCFFIVKQNSYIAYLFPILLLLLFFPIDKLLLLSVFFVPFSVHITYFFDFGANLDVPTEPIFIIILVIFLLKLIFEKKHSYALLKHPVSLSIIAFLAWNFLTSFTSSMPLVSIKHFIMFLWFIIPFYFFMLRVAKDKKNITKFLWLYIIPLTFIIIYFIILHSQSFFNRETANFLQKPFFNDHTQYGAVLVMFIPILFGFCLNTEYKKIIRFFSLLLLIFFIIALILSYARAAWLSLIVAIVFVVILKTKINYKVFFVSIAVVIASIFIFQNQIFLYLGNNKQNSSENLLEHVVSVSNVKTDASNKERLNRWYCAYRMFKEKPVFGWGAGTYSQQYGIFQNYSEKTTESTNSGDRGNAHNDYLGFLAETGFIGFLTYVCIIFSVIITSFKTYARLKSKSLKILLASLICSLCTYFVHAFLNNFLDEDKIAVPFWGMIAIIVVIDVYYSKFEEEKLPEKENLLSE
jgi:O-antigen ligase